MLAGGSLELSICMFTFVSTKMCIPVSSCLLSYSQRGVKKKSLASKHNFTFSWQRRLASDEYSHLCVAQSKGHSPSRCFLLSRSTDRTSAVTRLFSITHFSELRRKVTSQEKKLSATHFQDSLRHGSAWSKKKNSPKWQPIIFMAFKENPSHLAGMTPPTTFLSQIA